MLSMYAILSPKGCLIGGCVFAAVGIFLLIVTVNPKWRLYMRWKSGSSMSLFGRLSWILFIFSFAVGMIGAGLSCKPIIDHIGVILLVGFALIMIARIVDTIRQNFRNK